MSQPANHWKLGLFVTLGVLAVIALLGWVGSARLERESEISYYYFDEQVDGLEIGSPIKFRGVPIGKVVEIRVAPDQRHVEVVGKVFTDALARIGLERGARGPSEGPFVPNGLRVQVVTNFLTGTSFLQGDFFDSKAYPIPVYPFPIPWNTVYTAPSTGKGLAEGVEEIAMRLPPLLDETRATLTTIRTAVEDLHPGELSTRLLALTTIIAERLAGLENLEVVRQGTRTLARADETLVELQAIAAEWRREARVGETAQSVRDLSERLGVAADELTALGRDARLELGELREAVAAARRLAEILERDPGALVHGRSARPIPGLDGR